MKKEENTGGIPGNDDVLDAMEPPQDGSQDRTLVLKAEPRSRRAQLLAQGAKLIRCISCHGIKPLVLAEEFGDGWICEDCVPI